MRVTRANLCRNDQEADRRREIVVEGQFWGACRRAPADITPVTLTLVSSSPSGRGSELQSGDQWGDRGADTKPAVGARAGACQCGVAWAGHADPPPCRGGAASDA